MARERATAGWRFLGRSSRGPGARCRKLGAVETRLAVGGVVLRDDGAVLLVKRGRPPRAGTWSLPGGKVEAGESIAEAVVREVLEETGLEVVPGSIVEVFDRITREESTGRIRYHYVLVDFVCRVAGGRLLAASDAEEARWVERDELEAYRVAPFTVQVIEKAFRVLQG